MANSSNVTIDRSILSSGQFDRAQLEQLMTMSANMEAKLKAGTSHNIAQNKILATLFYEPSTRTRLSFEAAMQRLGGNIISETDVQFSSRTKGESLADTARMVGGYADVIAIRSTTVGDADIIAKYAGVPVINAGDGDGEHPTQSLLDLYTITKHFDLGNEPLHVTMVGDLKYGRTVHSLCKLLQNFPQITFSYVSPASLSMPSKYQDQNSTSTHTLDEDIIAQSDIIYMTRVQLERFADKEVTPDVKDFALNLAKAKKLKPSAIIMHPLPRREEIPVEIDDLPAAQYFAQARNGIPLRMALLANALSV